MITWSFLSFALNLSNVSCYLSRNSLVSNLDSRFSTLPVPSLAPRDGKRRGPGNEVAKLVQGVAMRRNLQETCFTTHRFEIRCSVATSTAQSSHVYVKCKHFSKVLFKRMRSFIAGRSPNRRENLSVST